MHSSAFIYTFDYKLCYLFTSETLEARWTVDSFRTALKDDLSRSASESMEGPRLSLSNLPEFSKPGSPMVDLFPRTLRVSFLGLRVPWSPLGGRSTRKKDALVSISQISVIRGRRCTNRDSSGYSSVSDLFLINTFRLEIGESRVDSYPRKSRVDLASRTTCYDRSVRLVDNL